MLSSQHQSTPKNPTVIAVREGGREGGRESKREINRGRERRRVREQRARKGESKGKGGRERADGAATVTILETVALA